MTWKRLDRRWLWLWVSLGALVGLVLLGGCQSGQKAEEQEAALRWQFQEQAIRCTQAIQAGDLEQARVHLSAAKAKALWHEQERQVQSLEKLIAGAEALMTGDGALARAEWSRIEDPRLSREVRVKAKLIDVDVPLMPVAEQEVNDATP